MPTYICVGLIEINPETNANNEDHINLQSV